MQLFTTLLPLNQSPTRHTTLHGSPDDNIAVLKPVLRYLKHPDSLPLHDMPLGAQSKLSDDAKGPLAVSCHSWNSENVKGHLRQPWELSPITDPPFNRIDAAPTVYVVVPVNLVLAIIIGTAAVVDKGLVSIVSAQISADRLTLRLGIIRVVILVVKVFLEAIFRSNEPLMLFRISPMAPQPPKVEVWI